MKSWQEKLFKISLMKKDKVRIISKLIDFSNKEVFDLGCKGGVVSYYLKKNGGNWIHSDLDLENLLNSKKILINNIFQTSKNTLPLKDNQFDIVLALDFLEHVDNDEKILKEINRILKKNGKVIISTPISGKFFSINWIKAKFGLTPQIYGHKREGYSLSKLNKMLENNAFTVIYSSTYSKFFVEFFETTLNIIYIKVNNIKTSKLRSGAISPSSEKDLNKNSKLMKIYSAFIYPIIYLITRIDKLLWFKTGYATLIIADKQRDMMQT